MAVELTITLPMDPAPRTVDEAQRQMLSWSLTPFFWEEGDGHLRAQAANLLETGLDRVGAAEAVSGDFEIECAVWIVALHCHKNRASLKQVIDLRCRVSGLGDA